MPGGCRVTPQTVGKWHSRSFARQLDGLLDEPRPGAPRKVEDAKVEQLIATTLMSIRARLPPGGTRLLARRLKHSRIKVGFVWRALSLQSHRTETFKLCTIRSH